MNRASVNNRKEYIDVARCLAIIFALSDHALRHFDVMHSIVGFYKYPIAIIFRSATPMFFLLFGLMIEYVYYRKYQRLGFKHLYLLSIKKAITCYLCFSVIIVIYNITCGGSISNAMEAFLFNSSEEGASGVLKFYTLAFLLLPLIVYLRSQCGIKAYAFIFIIIWVVIDPAIKYLFATYYDAKQGIDNFSAFMIGSPAGYSAYSLLHGISIVCLGGYIGSKDTYYVKSFQLLTSAIKVAALLVIVITFFLFFEGFTVFVEGFKTNYFRYSHHYVYYAFSTLCALLLLIFLCAFIKRVSVYTIVLPGKRSLFSFVFGGIILLMLPSKLGSIGVLVFWIIVYFSVYMYDSYKNKAQEFKLKIN